MALLSAETDTQEAVIERFELASKTHTERLLPMVDEVLAQAQCSLTQLDAIAFGRGPGSFTGLRICVGAVQGLAYGADLPVVPISSLAALAQTALLLEHGGSAVASIEAPVQILSTIDARMNEVYWGLYRIVDGLVSLEGVEGLTSPEQLILPSALPQQTQIMAVGTGFHYQERMACLDQVTLLDSELLPRARSIVQLARNDVINNNFCSAEKALPIYLRDQVAWKKQQG